MTIRQYLAVATFYIGSAIGLVSIAAIAGFLFRHGEHSAAVLFGLLSFAVWAFLYFARREAGKMEEGDVYSAPEGGVGRP